MVFIGVLFDFDFDLPISLKAESGAAIDAVRDTFNDLSGTLSGWIQTTRRRK